ncbi:hypothetical protein EVAR_71562_1 [Eumeta japonica]|uniref:Uncharacterized protein n=1 Tax=Eumeta variegata TaxID=151549 RepID=A0A4C1T410_EUMVA|nr:hypothetical protein EVAR_71562_1 [Eumeta japonica]
MTFALTDTYMKDQFRQRREGLWLCYRIALRALPEGYNIGTMGVGSPRVIPKEKLCQPWLRCLYGCNMVVLLPTNRLFSRFLGVVAAKLRHDAYRLRATCSECQPLEGSRAERR